MFEKLEHAKYPGKEKKVFKNTGGKFQVFFAVFLFLGAQQCPGQGQSLQAQGPGGGRWLKLSSAAAAGAAPLAEGQDSK